MAWFRIFIRGDNFLLQDPGTREIKRHGFYTTRFVEALAPESAEEIAVAHIRADPKLEGCFLDQQTDPPVISVEEIEEVSEADVPPTSLGFAYFVEDGD